MNVVSERGYLIPAVNNSTTDYVACARVLAKSIKYWHPTAKVCLLTNDHVDDSVFDYVKILPYGDQSGDQEWKLCNDWQVFWASPFRQTIKLEADMILTGPIDHWWTHLEKRDVVIAVGCRNFYNKPSTVRFYRRAFDQNWLPDVYNAITYWRLSHTAQQFFTLVKTIFNNWSTYATMLKGVDPNGVADTDTVYAIAATIMGKELVTLPQSSYPSFVHLKGQHNFCSGESWKDELVWELDQGCVRINTITQEYPLHYHDKLFVLELEKYYDKLLASS